MLGPVDASQGRAGQRAVDRVIRRPGSPVSVRRICYERASTLLTSNRPVEDWGKLLGDTAAVSALLDRLLHHSHVLQCGPRSYRTQPKTSLPAKESSS